MNEKSGIPFDKRSGFRVNYEFQWLIAIKYYTFFTHVTLSNNC